jgi:Spy/CpxP family protein refolding chaperone
MSSSVRRFVVGLAAFGLLSFCYATLTQAVEGGARPPRGGFRGMGGPGMMGGSSSQMWGFLLRTEQVQKELELVDDQKAKIKEMGDKAMAKMREGMGDREAMSKLSDEERKTRFAEMRKKMAAQAEETKKEIEEILLPHQIERLKQITLQLRGVAALEEKETQEAIGVTSEQLDKMKSIREAAMEKGRTLMEGLRDGTDQERRAKFQEFGKQIQEEVMGVLTSEQKEKFEKMKGPKFELDFAALRPRGGPGAKTEEKK